MTKIWKYFLSLNIILFFIYLGCIGIGYFNNTMPNWIGSVIMELPFYIPLIQLFMVLFFLILLIIDFINKGRQKTKKILCIIFISFIIFFEYAVTILGAGLLG